MEFNANSLNNRVTRQFYISNFFPFLYSLMLIELQCNIIQALDLVKEYPYRFLKTHTTDELSPKTNETSCDEVQI